MNNIFINLFTIFRHTIIQVKIRVLYYLVSKPSWSEAYIAIERRSGETTNSLQIEIKSKIPFKEEEVHRQNRIFCAHIQRHNDNKKRSGRQHQRTFLFGNFLMFTEKC